MTWTKLGDEFSDECANLDLTDAAYRTHVEAIAWLYRVERLDLHIPKRLAPRFMGSHEAVAAVADLVALGLWRDAGEAYVVEHHADVIRASITAQQNQRSRNKKASRAHRKKHAEATLETPSVAPATTADGQSPVGWWALRGSSVPYSPLSMAACSPVSTGSLSSAMDSSER